ncbi:MAG: zinc ABC transporter substrate-binding protein AztC [Phototrophicaceae bacterium]
MKRYVSVLLLSMFLLVLAPVSAQDDEALKVVASFSVLGDIVQNVGGEYIDLSVIVGINSDTHTFEPTPGDFVALSDADLIFENGLEFESFLDDMYTNSGSEAIRVEVSNGIDVLPFSEPVIEDGHLHTDEEESDDHNHAEEEASDDHDHAEEEESDDHDHAEEHEHGEFDPHWWMNPIQAIIAVENVRDTLMSLDPLNAEAYAENADAYIISLQEMDIFIREQLLELPLDRRVIVTTHDSLGYFAEAYDFTILSALRSISTEAAEPSPREIADLIEVVESTGVVAIFAENISNPELIEQIANAADVVVAPSLYTDALGDKDSDGSSYLDMLQYNVITIVEALG